MVMFPIVRQHNFGKPHLIGSETPGPVRARTTIFWMVLGSLCLQISACSVVIMGSALHDPIDEWSELIHDERTWKSSCRRSVRLSFTILQRSWSRSFRQALGATY